MATPSFVPPRRTLRQLQRQARVQQIGQTPQAAPELRFRTTPGSFGQVPLPDPNLNLNLHSAGGIATRQTSRLGAAAAGAPKITSKFRVPKFPLKVTPKGIGVVSLGLLATELAIHNLREAYKLYKLSQKESHFIPASFDAPPFTGGQGVGVRYNVEIEYSVFNPTEGKQRSSISVLGQIEGVRALDTNIEILCHDNAPGYSAEPVWRIVYSSGNKDVKVANPKIVSIVRTDGQPDTSGNLPGYSNSGRLEKRSGIASGTIPGQGLMQDPNIGWGKYLQAQSGQALQPNEQSKRKPVVVQIPPDTPVRFSFDSSVRITPFTITSDQPSQISVAPSRINPATNAVETPIKVSSPSSVSASSPSLIQQPATLVAPGNGPVTITIPGQQPITINPDGTAKPTGLTLSQSEPRAFVPTPATTPTPTTPETPQLPNFKDKNLQEIGLTLVGITQLLKSIQPNVSPEALENAAAAGTCRTTQPGGCTSNAMNDAVNRGNQDLLNKLNTSGQAADLALLGVINAKLGPQMPGGLSSGLGRMSKFLGIDRIFNLLNFLAILHNASMLSGSLKVTLLETLSSVGNATGLLQTSEGDNTDLNQVFNSGVEGLIVSLIGAEAWASMKLTWRKYSAIYRAGTNVLSNVGNMFSSIGNGIEVIGEHTGKIGNALRQAAVVKENAYNYMSENMNVHTNKFMTFQTTVGGVTQVLEAVNEVAESTIEGQEAYTEAVKATKEFKEHLEKAEKKPGIDNAAIKTEAAQIKKNSTSDPTGEDEQGLLSFLTDL